MVNLHGTQSGQWAICYLLFAICLEKSANILATPILGAESLIDFAVATCQAIGWQTNISGEEDRWFADVGAVLESWDGLL